MLFNLQDFSLLAGLWKILFYLVQKNFGLGVRMSPRPPVPPPGYTTVQTNGLKRFKKSLMFTQTLNTLQNLNIKDAGFV